MHGLRAHRAADGADGKMRAPADALGRPRRRNRPSCRLESPVGRQYLKFVC
jgi:hypothetical protein